MTMQEIYDLMTRMEHSSLQSMKLTDGEFSIELVRGGPSGETISYLPERPAAVPEAPMITAPVVGTYYASPSPEEAPYVKAGDRVKKGQSVCILEAMKMMSEVPAPCDCIIEAVLKKDGELVSFGEPLFRYKPC